MKRIILLLAIYMFLFSACKAQGMGAETFDLTVSTLEGFQTNNMPISNDAVTYPISKLQNFFEPSSLPTDNLFADVLYLDEINEQFPVKYLRKIEIIEGHDRFYIAYPVSEGGKYLVFLGAVVDPVTDEKRSCYLNSLYVYNLPNEDSFAALNVGDSYSEVLNIAPYTCTPIVSSGIVSHSLLSNGNVMQCSYSRANGQELTLEKMELLTPEDPQYPFAGMLPSDLIE